MSIDNNSLKRDINKMLDNMDIDGLLYVKEMIINSGLADDVDEVYDYYMITEGLIYENGINCEFDENSYNAVAHFIHNNYCNIFGGCSYLSEVIKRIRKNYLWELNQTEYNEIDRQNRFNLECAIHPVITNEDRLVIEKMLHEKKSIEEIKQFIKKSKTSGYVYMSQFGLNLVTDDYLLSNPKVIFNYELMCQELKKMDLELKLKDFSKNVFVDNSYDLLLDNQLNNSPTIFALIYNNSLEIDNEDYQIFNKNKVYSLKKND